MIDEEVLVTEAAPATEPVAPSPVAEAPSEPTPVRDSVRAALETLKKDGEQTAASEEKSDRTRAADGRFAKPDASVEKPSQTISAPAAIPPIAAPAAVSAPPGWSVKSKADWTVLPQHVRDDIARRESEVSQGFAEYKGLGRFMEQARSSGTTLETALENYTGIEAMLRENPLQGIMRIAQNIGLHPAQLAQQIMAATGGQQQPQPNQSAPADDITALYPEFGQLINPLAGRLQQTEGMIQQILHDQHQRQAAEQTRHVEASSSAIDSFASDPKNRYFDNVAPLINQLFKGGVVPRTGNHAADLAKAYEMACQLDPDVRAQLNQEQLAKLDEERKAKAVAARKAAVSLSGAPANGAAASFNPAAGSSVRDSVRAAMEQLRSQV